MDLAKIRQKARQDRELMDSENFFPESASAGETGLLCGATPSVAANTTIIHDTSIHSQPIYQVSDVQGHEICREESAKPPLAPVRDPLAVILAGRAAAGCDEDLPLASTEMEEISSKKYLEFLCFRVSDEFYGINIMDIKEIIKPRETTEVPRSPSFVSGVISLRGTIIPIIDMLERLGLARETLTGKERVIVVKLKEALSGLLVDEIVQVVRIAAETLEPAPAVLDGIDRDFVTGIGRADGKMVIILNLETVADINLF